MDFPHPKDRCIYRGMYIGTSLFDQSDRNFVLSSGGVPHTVQYVQELRLRGWCAQGVVDRSLRCSCFQHVVGDVDAGPANVAAMFSEAGERDFFLSLLGRPVQVDAKLR